MSAEHGRAVSKTLKATEDVGDICIKASSASSSPKRSLRAMVTSVVEVWEGKWSDELRIA